MYKFHPHRVANFQLGGLPSLTAPTPQQLEQQAGLSGQKVAGGYDVGGGIGNIAKGAAAGGPVGAGIAAIPELYKVFQGFQQKRKAKGLAQARPEYQIPQAQTEALNTLRAGALDPRVPGETAAREGLGASTQRGIEAIQQSGSSPAEIIAGISNMASQEQQGLNQIGIQGAQSREQRRRDLVGGLGQQAQYEQAQQQYNTLDPYAQDMQAKAALEEGSAQNIFGGVKGLSSLGVESTNQGAVTPGGGSTYSPDQISELLNLLG